MAAGSRAVFGAHIVGSIPTVIFIFEFLDSNLRAGLHAPFYVLNSPFSIFCIHIYEIFSNQKSTFIILTVKSFSLVQFPMTAVVDTTSPTGRLALRASNAWFIMILFVIILYYLFNIPVVFNLIEHCKDNEQNLNKRTFCSIFHLIQYYLTLSED